MPALGGVSLFCKGSDCKLPGLPVPRAPDWAVLSIYSPNNEFQTHCSQTGGEVRHSDVMNLGDREHRVLREHGKC